MTNPYEVLNLDPKSSIDDVKKAFYHIAQAYHPDKGGDPKVFRRYQEAYHQILTGTADPSGETTYVPRDFNHMREGARAYKHQHKHKLDDFTAGSQFNRDKFNDVFRKERKESDGYVYNIDASEGKDRNKQEFEREYAQITAQAESIPKMFPTGSFDHNAFNRAFMQMKDRHQTETHDIDEYKEPEPSGCLTMMQYTDIENPTHTTNLSMLGGADYYNAYAKSHQNPHTFTEKELQQLKSMPDITKEHALSARDIQERLEKYKSMPLEYNKEKLVTDINIPLQRVEGLESRKAQLHHERQLDDLAYRHYQQQMPMQQMPMQQMPMQQMPMQQMPMQQMPMQQMAVQQMAVQQIPYQLRHPQPQMPIQQIPYQLRHPQPPTFSQNIPVKNRTEHNPTVRERNSTDELAKVKRTVKKQQKLIKQLLIESKSKKKCL